MSSSCNISEPIAVIGIGCRFPGASSTTELVDVLSDPADLSQTIPSDRFSIDGYHHDDGSHHGSTNVRKSYFLQDSIRKFDNNFFNVTAVEASSIDPQQRILLETVHEAFENANVSMPQLRGSDTAVYVGLMCGDYESLLYNDLETVPRYMATGVARSIIANRISYIWDLRGPSMTIDTACSSSLVALHQGVQALRLGETNLALVAGSNLLLGPECYVTESSLNMLSPTGKSRMWDAEADGYARGEGVAAIVLKRLSDAVADGDFIECIVRETGVGQDGHTNGITTPGAESQASLIRRVYAKAGLDVIKDGCQYFEAHGTGTPAGDPVEAEAIHSVFTDSSGNNVRTAPIYVGSVKTVIGHTEGTAGLAGLIKATTSLQRKTIFPNKHFNKLNPRITPFYGNLQVPTVEVPWPKPPNGQPLRASVNSFGFGGTNAHAILESYDNGISPNRVSEDAVPLFVPVVFSAKSAGSLYGGLADYVQWLNLHPEANIRDVAITASRRSPFAYRAAIPSASSSDLSSKLSEAIRERRIVTPARSTPRTIGIFTGQGAQSFGMMAEVLRASPWAQNRARQLEEMLLDMIPLEDRPPHSLVDQLLLGRSPDGSSVMEASLSQPLCTLVQILLVDVLQTAGIKFSAVVGHSSGEISAAYAAGYLTAENALGAAYYRGMHTRLASGPDNQQGAMLAASMSYKEARRFCARPEFKQRICVAASNSPSSVTLSGDEDAIIEAEEFLQAENANPKRLVVDKAYHSHHMNPCSSAYLESLRALPGFKSDPNTSTKWFSSVHVREASEFQLTADYWNDNMAQPVLFSQALEKACNDVGSFDLVIEVGPHPALRAPVMQTLQNLDPQNQPAYTFLLRRGQDSVQSFREGFAQLWQAGLNPKLAAVEKLMSGISSQPLRGLPIYHWQHDQEFWHEPYFTKALRRRKQPARPLIGIRLPDSSDVDMRWRNVILESELPWLSGHKIQGQTVFPGAGYICMAIEAAQELNLNNQEIQTIDVTNLDISQALLIPPDDPGVEVVCTMTNVRRSGKTIIIADFSLYAAIGDSLSLMVKAVVKLQLGPSKGEILPSTHQQGIADCSMRPIDSDVIYSGWNNVGFTYSGPFRAIQNASRKLSAASGSIANAPGEGSMPLHPGTLDAAIQSLLLAYCHPEDGTLVSPQVPRTIRNVRINFGLVKTVGLTHPQFEFTAVVPDREASGACGDVELFTQEGQSIVQIESLQYVRLSPATKENDLKAFWYTKWVSASPGTQNFCRDGQATEDDYELVENLERLSFYHITQLEKAFPQGHPQRQHPNWKNYFGFVAHVRSLVDSGVHPYVKKDWLQDTSEVVTAIAARYPDNPHRRVIDAVGDNITQIVHSGSTILEHPLRSLLDDYYAHGMADQSYARNLARVVGYLADRFPTMNILEIGASNRSVTKTVFEEIGCTFDTYTCTDVSVSQSENARDLFPAQKDKIVFSSLDLERDVVEQGFNPQSYDLVIASLALHATSNLKNTLSNVRKLLKPGGYVVMLEITNNDPIRHGFVFGTMPQWWIGEAEGRVLSPCIEPPKWDAVLQQSGFSSIDSMVPDVHRLQVPFSVITAQAVDNRVQLLRNPLANKTAFPRLLVVGGATPNSVQLVSSVCELLGQHYEVVLNIRTLEDFSDAYHGCTVLSLSELDRPVFENINDGTLRALNKIMSNCPVLLWATHGARDKCPGSMMAIGFFRTMMWERPELTFRSIDFLDESLPDSDVICSSLLELEMGVSWNLKTRGSDILWPLERELVYKNGHLEIPRVVPSPMLNDRYNCSQRLIVRKNGNTPIRLSHDGWLDQEVSVRSNKALTSTYGKRLQLKVEYSTSFSVPVLDSGPSNSYLVFGRVANSRRPVLALVPKCGSTVKPLSCSVCEVQDDSNPSLVLTQVASVLQAVYLLSHVPKGQRLLVHNPDAQFAAAIKSLAKDRDIRVTMTSTDPQTKFIHLHPHMPARLLKDIINPSHHYFADLSKTTESPTEAYIRQLLPKSMVIIDTQPIIATDGSRLATPLTYGSSLNPAETIPVSAQLSAAYDISHGLPMHSLGLVSLSDFSSQRPNRNKHILQWSDTESAFTRVLPTGRHLAFLPHRTYWLVGLTGDTGLSLSELLVRKGARYVVLSSRNPKISPEWLEQQSKAGVKIAVIPCDAANKASLSSAYDKIKDSFPPLAGVAHGGMVLEDVPVGDLDADKFAKVAAPKVAGSTNLDRLFEEHGVDLDFLVFFSSSVGTVGNYGQSNYSAANLYMQTLALQRRQRGRAASILNLGLIIGIGYAMSRMNRSQLEALGKNGVKWISEEDVHHSFGEAVLASPPSSDLDYEVTIGLDTFSAGGPSAPPWAEEPRMSHLFNTDPNMSLASKRGGVGAQKSPREKLAEAPSLVEAEIVIKECFLIELQNILKLSPSQMEDEKTLLDTSTDQLGFDSLIAVEVRSWFLKTFDVRIATLQMMSANIQGIIDLALSKLDKPSTPHLVMESESKAQRSEASSPLSEADVASPSTEDTRPSSRGSFDQNVPRLMEPESPQEDGTQHSPRYGPHPLSIGQEMFWFVEKLMPNANPLNGLVVYRMTGSPDVARLSEAVRMVGKRHEAIRTAIFESENGSAVQAILDYATVHLETLSASHDAIPDIIQNFAKHCYRLDQGQIMRILLVSSSPTEHYLFIGSHHINMDGISLQVILSELEAFYKGEDLPGSPLQFADFAKRQRENNWSDLLSFWQSELSGISEELPILRLPDAARVRQPLNEYRNTEISRRVNSSTMAKVRVRCRELRVTQFQFYLAIFRVLLVRLAKVDDICIGIADANRLSEDTLEAVGMYLNLLPLRFQSTCNQRFSDIAQDTKQKVQSAIAHSALPFGLLLENMGKLGLRRSADHSPIFQTFVDYRQGAREQQPFGDCKLDVRYWHGTKTAYDISLDIVDYKEVPTYIRLAVQDSLYSRADAELLMDSYMHLIDVFATSANEEDCLIERVPIFNDNSIGTKLSFAKGKLLERSSWPGTLAHRVAEISASYPEKTAIKDGNGTILTYAGMSNRVAAVASGIRKLEVQPGSVIGVFQEPTADFVCSLLAIWHAGCVYMPLDPATPMPRLETQVHHCSPQLILVDNRLADAAASFGTPLLNVSYMDAQESSGIVSEVSETKSTDPAAVLYTSGSTGVPKGIVLSHQNLIHELEFSPKNYDFGFENVLCQSALGFDMSLTQIFTALAFGGCVHMVTLAERGDALSITKRIVDDGITFTGATPSEYLSWLAYGVPSLGQSGSSWRRAVCGGEPIPPALLRSFASIANRQLRLFNAYGPTETTCSVTRIEVPYRDLAQASSKVQLTAGHVALNCSVCIVDSDLRPLPVGMPGEVLIGGAKVAIGYLGNEALTQERFVDHDHVPDEFAAEGWASVHRTGDVGWLRPDGQLVLEGRVAGDSQIKLRGNRVDLTDVEDAILRAGQGHLIEALVCVPTKADSGDASSDSVLLAALVVTDASLDPQSPEENQFLTDVLRRVDLPRALRPTTIRSAPALPKSANGKADRKAAAELLRIHLDTFEASDNDESLSGVESQLQQAWTEVLPFNLSSKIRRSSDFFHAGGNSLLLVALQRKIQEVFNVKLPLVSVFEQSTLSNMALLIEQNSIEDTTIDWDRETDPENCIPADYLRPFEAYTVPERGCSVVLTGATGFLGKALLRTLVTDKRISTIHCIAVRNAEPLEPFKDSGKVVVHHGNLTLPRLGLSTNMARYIFSTADIIIHNGADVSHLKSYRTIKSANVGSTQELVKLSLEHGRPIPFHFVSTAGVSLYSGLETFGEVSAAPFPPPTDNSDGYTASKWASERFLERVHGMTELPVWVHRPSNIHRFEDPQFDLFQNLLRYSRLMKAVPAFSSMQGHLNLVEVVDVAKSIHNDIFIDANLEVNYRHRISGINLSMDRLADFVSDQVKSSVEVLDVHTWSARAESQGLSETVTEWFKKVAFGSPVRYPLLVTDRD
ncbi:AMP-binding enzyme [Colletotrichum navitas]|uniref:AMP-binding enzyme n=1 Tax=Colletotrichum navitas TaxID=681940 RepID=A0AAD8Q3U8_9PEZI|nr:AMP-binding enzyme [Colletotrichum navitas]KAK1594656.1 AMP-binding enzyme [Colletotrichum navitas]